MASALSSFRQVFYKKARDSERIGKARKRIRFSCFFHFFYKTSLQIRFFLLFVFDVVEIALMFNFSKFVFDVSNMFLFSVFFMLLFVDVT